MKTLLFSLILIVSGLTTLQAQFNQDPILNLENEDKKLLNWGYFLGFNQYDFKVDYKAYNYSSSNTTLDDIYVKKSIGFNVGLIGELRINKYLDLRLEPGLYYNQRDVSFPNTTMGANSIELKSTYIHIPLLLKVSTKRLGNIKPFIVGGAATSLNLSSNEESSERISDGIIRMDKTNYYWEVGFGIDIYLRYFKFSPSIRGSFAFQDDILRDGESPYLDHVSGTYSRAIFVNFTFE